MARSAIKHRRVHVERKVEQGVDGMRIVDPIFETKYVRKDIDGIKEVRPKVAHEVHCYVIGREPHAIPKFRLQPTDVFSGKTAAALRHARDHGNGIRLHNPQGGVQHFVAQTHLFSLVFQTYRFVITIANFAEILGEEDDSSIEEF